ncbi:hypothetical protein LCGC14_2106260, partial [marine sediment metagenome]
MPLTLEEINLKLTLETRRVNNKLKDLDRRFKKT